MLHIFILWIWEEMTVLPQKEIQLVRSSMAFAWGKKTLDVHVRVADFANVIRGKHNRSEYIV